MIDQCGLSEIAILSPWATLMVDGSLLSASQNQVWPFEASCGFRFFRVMASRSANLRRLSLQRSRALEI